MAKEKRKPQVRINVEDMDKILKLPEARLKVWLYYKRRYGADGRAWGKNSTIALALGFAPGTIKNARSWLIKNGWLKPNGFSDFGLAMYIPVIGVLPEACTNAGRHCTMTVDASDSAAGCIHECGEGALDDAPEVTTLEVPTSEAITLEVLRPSDEVNKSANESEPSAHAEGLDEQTEVNQFFADPSDADAKFLLLQVYPNMTLPLVQEQMPHFKEIISLANSEGFDPSELLQWNRAHKKGGLFIRSGDQYLNALKSSTLHLLNDYKTHDFTECPICKRKSFIHPDEKDRIAWEHEQAEQAQVKLREQEELRTREDAERKHRHASYQFRMFTDEERDACNRNKGGGWPEKLLPYAQDRKWPLDSLNAAIIWASQQEPPVDFDNFELVVLDAMEATAL
jgi:hypothetical protein